MFFLWQEGCLCIPGAASFYYLFKPLTDNLRKHTTVKILLMEMLSQPNLLKISCRHIRKRSARAILISFTTEAMQVHEKPYGSFLTNYMLTKNRNLKSQKFQRNNCLERGKRALISTEVRYWKLSGNTCTFVIIKANHTQT